ncbi:hypothetical protein [Pseudemcibacter aquimaris]|uniref:hypothetical protein n=1 Tax=Pseudemcibacter aquimaris TaxID=2857064 RepID=UPI00201175F4|nr:hypothetical protein [Pseudemcibacter aquimaris]MCC3862438.1 hypothetical protein [Pseudemcibacter aquimaris]WDU59133.1 hypothetical protein KW060_02470 [Pseudemcibacter aquimaris]
MFKKAITSGISILALMITMITSANASLHASIPTFEDQQKFDLAYYENKENRCLQAFAQSEFEMAFSICTPLANLGFKDAQLITGLLYAYGEGVDKDLRRAKIWLTEALKNGREDAADALTQFGLN